MKKRSLVFDDSRIIKSVGKKVPSRSKPVIISFLNLLKTWEFIARGTLVKIHRKPVFILGNQKAGTSVIAALLSQATGCSVSIDLAREFLGNGSVFKKIKNGSAGFDTVIQRNRLDFSRDIIKEANLTPFYDDIAARFPKSKCVFIIRDPADNLRSQLNRWDIPGNMEDLRSEDVRQIKKSWQIIFDGTWLGLTGNGYIEMLAQRWRYLADLYWTHRKNMILIRYEDFIKDKVREICHLADRLNLDLRHDISHKVNIQYQSKGRSDVTPVAFFGEKNLRRIETICHVQMERFGYPSYFQPEGKHSCQ
jgi:hypothetical protein